MRHAAAPRDVVGQCFDQRLQIGHALAQRGHADRQHIEAVVQVGTKRPFGHHGGQVAAGGGDDAHIDALHPVAAQRLHLLFLQHAQQLGLQGQRHVADLVEQQGAAIGPLELAIAALALGPGVGACRHAEKLGLEQGVGHRRDVHADEGFGRARAGGMDAMREQFLAGAGFAQQQHGAVGLRYTARLALDLHRRSAGPNEAGDGVLGSALRGKLAARIVKLTLQAAELGDERLHRGFGVIQQHHAQGADHLTLRVAQRQAADDEGAGLVAQQVHQDRLAGIDHLGHQGVGHHLFDTPPDEVGFGMAQRRQEAFVAVADPDDAVLAVDHHHAHGRAGQGVEHALSGQLEHAVGIGRQSGWGNGHAAVGGWRLTCAGWRLTMSGLRTL